MLLRMLLSLVLNAVTLLVVSALFDSFYIAGFMTAIIASFILSIFNVLLKPILIIFTLPLTIFTLGFFLFVINAIILMLTQMVMGASFEINGFGTAIIASIVISIINLILNRLMKDTLE